ncbi:MAG TPA: hypothetical protein VEL49_04330 [Ktedonobacteraceae bacterium]|nr:hypothetical protein [Ktedonobacteraceae bacterium]
MVGQIDEEYVRAIIKTILEITIVSWCQIVARGEICSSSDERDIAGCLYREMYAEKRRRLGPKAAPRIEEEVGTRSSPKIRRSDGRIDFKIIYTLDEDEYFGMECKRIDSKGNKLIRKYVLDGVMRFIDGKYCLGHSWAAMLGFVIDGKSTDCIKMVTNHLIKTKGKNRMKNNWTTETSFGPHKDLYRTRHHQRGRNSLMTILHLFLTIPPTLSIETNGNEPLLNPL